MKKISYINGPGSHGALLLNTLVTSKIPVRHFQYYPRYADNTYENGKLVASSSSLLFQLKDRLIANYYNKLRGNNKRYNELLWDLYDRQVSEVLDRNEGLIAWPQVSLKSMQKVKGHAPVVLEYPMVHVGEWQQQMKREYARLGINGSKNIFLGQVEKKMREEIQLADKINVLSSYARQTFINNGVDGSKLNIVAPYVDEAVFFIDDQCVKESKFTFLFVGRIDVLKGAHLLLEAFFRLGIKDSQLIMAGHLNEEVKEFMLMYPDNVKYLPYQNPVQLCSLYNSSHVLVLPSVQESFGMVCSEAMLCGLPVIVSSNTVAGDLVDENSGFVFEAGNTDDLVGQCRRIYENYAHFNSETIRQIVLSKFNPAIYADNYRHMLQSIQMI